MFLLNPRPGESAIISLAVTTMKMRRVDLRYKENIRHRISRHSFSFPAPTKPENLTSREITGTTIELSWSEPENANGVIAGYRVYYMYSNYTDVKMHIPDKSPSSSDVDASINFVLKELREYTSCT